jgi:hypothetical protein
MVACMDQALAPGPVHDNVPIGAYNDHAPQDTQAAITTFSVLVCPPLCPLDGCGYSGASTARQGTDHGRRRPTP